MSLCLRGLGPGADEWMISYFSGGVNVELDD